MTFDISFFKSQWLAFVLVFFLALSFFSNVFTRELNHRFRSFLTTDQGNPYGVLGRDLAHWGVFFDADFSPMDGNDWVDNGDGTFTLNQSFIDEARFKRSTEAMPYNDLDLYTMGLLDPSQVKSSFVIENPTLGDGRKLRPYNGGPYVEIQDPVTGIWSGPTYLPSDLVVRGTKRNIALSDITALEGLRSPAFPNTQKDFKVAFINLTNEEDASIDKLEMTEKLGRFKDSFLDFFEDMARNLGSLSTPVGELLGSGAMSAFSGLGSEIAEKVGTVPIFSPSPLFSRSGFKPFEPIDRLGLIQRNFEAGLTESGFGASLSYLSRAFNHTVIARSEATKAGAPAPALNRNPLTVPSLEGTKQSLSSLFSHFDFASGTPVSIAGAVPELLTSSLNLESLAKPILYSEWKQEQGIKTSDPFAMDPLLSSPLPLLVNPEKMVTVPVSSTPVIAPARQAFGGSPERPPSLSATQMADPSSGGRGSVPSDAAGRSSGGRPLGLPVPNGQFGEAIPQAFGSSPSPLPPSLPNPKSKIHNPKFSLTPLIWDALADRYKKGSKDEDRQKLRPFFVSRRKRTTT